MDGIYASHIRDETDGVTDALAEAVTIGLQLGVRVQVSHLKTAGRSNHGRAGEALAVLGDARAAGVRVTQDAYPYLAGSTLLTQLLPPWAHDGGTDELVKRLGSPDIRARIAAEIGAGLPGWPNYFEATGGPASIQIAAVTNRSSGQSRGPVPGGGRDAHRPGSPDRRVRHARGGSRCNDDDHDAHGGG